MALLDDIKVKVSAAVRATRDTVAVTAAFNVGRIKIVETRIRKHDILRVLGGADGQAVIDAIVLATPATGTTPAQRLARPLATAMELLSPNSTVGLDVGETQTRAQIDGLVPAILTVVQATAIKALAEVPDLVSEFDVRVACWSPAGVWLA